MRARWVSTVRALMKSSRPISMEVLPRRSRSKTSRSRAVSTASGSLAVCVVSARSTSACEMIGERYRSRAATVRMAVASSALG